MPTDRLNVYETVMRIVPLLQCFEWIVAKHATVSVNIVLVVALVV